jgi:MFS family permease
MQLPHTFRALRHRDYRVFLQGQAVSLVGTWLQSVAQAWLVYRLTGSALHLGFVTFCSQIPVFLLSPLGGAVADRTNRLRLLVGTQAVSMALAFTLGTLTLTGAVTVTHVYVLATLLGIANSFDIPARQSFVPSLVPRPDLSNAIALNSSIFNAARIVGPALAGVMIAAVGEGWCFVLNGASFLAVIGVLLRIRTQDRPRSTGRSPLADIVEGVRFAAHNGPVRSLLLLTAATSLLTLPYTTLMPLMADRVLGAGSRGLGLLMASTGLGALTGAMLLASRRTEGGLGRWVATGVSGLGVGLIAFAASRILVLSAVLLAGVGLATLVQMASSNTLLQTLTPGHLRGRVMALYSMMFLGMAPFGGLAFGAVATHAGVAWTIAGGGVLAVLTSLIFLRELPRLRVQTQEMLAEREAERALDPAENGSP